MTRLNPAMAPALKPEDQAKEYFYGLDAESIRKGLLTHLEFTLAELPKHVDSEWEPYLSLALTVRDRLIERWSRTQDAYYANDAKRVYYMSLEFLMGRALTNSLINLDINRETAKAVHELGYDLEQLSDAEWDAGLGNGGLGRLAACFLDSLATLELPAYGYGIRYEYGLFHQRIANGHQVEVPDAWLRYGNPWEIPRPNDFLRVKFYGHVHEYTNDQGRFTVAWVNTEDVLALPYDTPIPGYKNGTANTLRLWSAKATDEFDLSFFNQGDYEGAVEAKSRSENITKVLYPNDNVFEGRELRLKQEYFFVSATLLDIIRRYKKRWKMFDQQNGFPVFARFAEKNAIQLNDSHPAIAIPELMRILVDIEQLDWDTAWDITCKTFAYTNHTVMPEALERWVMNLLGQVLPRHLQIIYEINHRFLNDVRQRFPGDDERCRRMSIIEEGPEKRVRMANLAIVGSHAVNGVAAMHTEILKTDVFRDFYEMWPEKFSNKTNGISQRRWLKEANPALSDLITQVIGEGWVTDLFQLTRLAGVASDAGVRDKWRAAKRQNKLRLIEIIESQYRHRGEMITINPDSLFDCQVKRIHEYKRQLLNVLHAITLYNRIKDNPNGEHVPRTIIFGGKAAPGYFMAKLIIRLINAVGQKVNNDKDVRDLLRVVFLADYRVSLAEKIFPASELSEQISTAGTEASGTSNMKFALNGALIIGTMDGANVEIQEEVGDDNIFIFGLTTEQVNELKPHYDPWSYYQENAELRRVIDQIRDGFFSPQDPNLFHGIFETLLGSGRDNYLLLADYGSYIDCQKRVGETYRRPVEWTKKSILNVAHMGKFSTDRTIKEYADEIWSLTPVRIGTPDRSPD
ncbi:MAG TPA: glycogen/starch/alpha-glucan phosphorylase [Candidatus Angelobacter sp.]|nr:glycogen/starch/alpha-glucan phosphorylase [Candidatus Angelobacter sp.]